MSPWKKVVSAILDVLCSPLTLLATLYMRLLRRVRLEERAVCWGLFRWLRIFPLYDFYAEPMFHPRHLHRPLGEDRDLPGIDWNVSGQLALLERFDYEEELREMPAEAPSDLQYGYRNAYFGPGDADFLYAMIRHFKPRRIVEIGSGHSTLVAIQATRRNADEDPTYECEHTCIEPYRSPWLEGLGVRVIRQRVETLGAELFDGLQRNDILFVDSSHVIRPQGDVVVEHLELLPSLRPGVLVHVHDIFTPRDYPEHWVTGPCRFFNEQYLVEAFLSFNHAFRIIGALNYLWHHHRDRLVAKCPLLQAAGIGEPGSLWLVRND